VTSIDEALRWGPEAAVIANPATLHVAAALPLADAGVHLLVEKPIAGDSREARALVARARARGIVLMVGYNLRFVPSLVRFRALIEEGYGGRVRSIRTEVGGHLPTWRPGADYRESVSARAALGGGVLLELSHEIDYLRWIFGDIECVSAAIGTNGGLDIDVEDTAHLVLHFARDASAPLMASLDMDFIRHDPVRRCTLIGDAGSLRWDGLTDTVDYFAAGSSGWRTLAATPAQRDESYRREWQHFLARIADGGQPMVTGEDGLAALEVVTAARRAGESGCRVRIGATA
jgi:predicted dehydrogenase